MVVEAVKQGFGLELRLSNEKLAFTCPFFSLVGMGLGVSLISERSSGHLTS